MTLPLASVRFVVIGFVGVRNDEHLLVIYAIQVESSLMRVVSYVSISGSQTDVS